MSENSSNLRILLETILYSFFLAIVIIDIIFGIAENWIIGIYYSPFSILITSFTFISTTFFISFILLLINENFSFRNLFRISKVNITPKLLRNLAESNDLIFKYLPKTLGFEMWISFKRWW